LAVVSRFPFSVLQKFCNLSFTFSLQPQPEVDARAIVCAYLCVRTTIELPTPLFRNAKAAVAARGTTLKEFITEAVQRALASPSEARRMEHPPVPRGKRTIRARSNREIAALLEDEDLRKAR
jgi:hypothetical protein